VRSTHASARFATAAPDLGEIAAALDVDVVLLGTLLPAGERCRVVTQLVEAPSGRVLWSQTSDVTERDVFALQDLLTKRIVESLQLPLSSRERHALQAQAATNPTAYEFFLRANRASFVGHELHVARSLYLKAIEADPEFAPAWARLGRCYRVIGKYLTKDHAPSYAQAEDALERALAIHPDHPGAHHVKAQLDLDLGRPEAALERLLGVVERNPNDPEGFAGLVTALRYLGMVEASIRAHERARQLDPDIATSALHSYLTLGQHELALSESSRHPEADRALVFLEMGRRQDALEDARGYEQRERGNLLGEWARLVVAVLEGDPSAGRDMAVSHRDFPDPEGRYYVGELAAALGFAEEALEMIDRSAGVGYANVPRMMTTRHFRAFRGDARFTRLLDRARKQHEAAVAGFGDRVRRIFGMSNL
jgi:tetratricopeptide (TPR) repeat protein